MSSPADDVKQLAADAAPPATLVFGTMEYVDGSQPPSALYEGTLAALKAGYRSFDTAEMYATTAEVGRALQESGVPRKELTLISKLKGMPTGSYEDVLARVRDHLARLQTTYVDLLFMHWPGSSDVSLDAEPAAVESQCSWSWFTEHLTESWKLMQRLQADGLARQIGVSNFYPAHLRRLCSCFPRHEWPAANEIYIDVAHAELEFVEEMQRSHIQVLAYRATAFLPMYSVVPESPHLLLYIATERSGADNYWQLVLAWLLWRGISPLVKTVSPDKLASNWKALELSRKEQAQKEFPTLNTAVTDSAAVEMLDMMGAGDEYAAAFRRISTASLHLNN